METDMNRTVHRIRAWGAASIVLALAVVAAGENLITDPSFEVPKPRDKFGLVFKDWSGWIYEGGSHFEVGKVARTGKHSCEIVGARGGKIRARCKAVKLAPGRYRLKAHFRGLDLGPGRWKRVMDFCVDGKAYPDMSRTGTFGWTPMTYVFDAVERKEPYQVQFGLWETGRLWIDDVSLEKVDASVPLTPKPVWGKEESPIAAPGEIKAPQRCKTCGYRNDASWKACYACGHGLTGGAKRTYKSPAVKVFADFEEGEKKLFVPGKIVAEHATRGKRALRVDKSYSSMDVKQDWSEHDFVHFDVYNPKPIPARLYVEVRDAGTTGYWTRVNLNTIAAPGKSTISLPTQLYVGEKSRPGRPLMRDKVIRFVVSVGKDGPLYFDNFRLQRLATDEMVFDGLYAIDFGPPGSPVMEGFMSGDQSTPYVDGRGYGWTKGRMWRSFDARQPEVLTQDFVCPETAGYRFAVPNGKYRVKMIIASPGGFWGEVQKYRKRTLTINGKTVLEETMDRDAFVKRYFSHANVEDLPGVDPYETYVKPVLKWHSFETRVSDGKLQIDFAGANWAFCLSALVVYPAETDAKGERFMKWVDARRRFHFDNYFKQAVPPRRGAKPPKTGYTLFQRHFMDPPGAHDGPMAGEIIDPAKGLSVTVARGEPAVVAFSLQPGEKSVGAVDVAVSQLAQRAGAVPKVRPGWLDFRLSRVQMDGSVYTVKPRYWHPTPAPAADGVTRTFWLRVNASSPGVFKGKVTVKPAGASATELPLTVTVLPFKLDPIDDVAVGPWGSGIALPWYGDDEKTRQWHWTMYAKALDALRAVGCTSFSARPHVRVHAAKGKITRLDTERADREMALARAKGFRHMISNYGSPLVGYRNYGTTAGADSAAAKQAGFANADAYLKAVYAALDAHAVEKNWLPVAWNLCDEPLGPAIPGAVKNALAHRAAGKGLKLMHFMGATSMKGNDPKDPHYPLVKALPIASVNTHDDKSIGVMADAGSGFSFYNGGNRWTYGRYMKMLVVKHRLLLRLSWHCNVVAGDPYYALDCREDDYCWFNTNADGTLVPSLRLLSEIQPGLNDYRYLSTLQRLLKEKPDHPAAAAAKKTFAEMTNLTAGKDRGVAAKRANEGLDAYEADRAKVIEAIKALLK